MDDNTGTTGARLRACAARLRTLDEERRGEQSRRDGLVRQYRDEGNSWSAVASAAGISIARCVAIVGGE